MKKPSVKQLKQRQKFKRAAGICKKTNDYRKCMKTQLSKSKTTSITIKPRTLSQNRKIAKDTGMSLAEVKALDAEYIRRQKEISKMRK